MEKLETKDVIMGLIVTAGVALVVVILWDIGKSIVLPVPKG